jgi:pimeloyl-ACP methyl ester carboxylesterase
VNLAFQRIDGSRPKQTVAFLHGILGSGRNLRTIATRFIEQRPEWSAWLVDLRGHGDSPKGSPEPTLEATARDVVTLAQVHAIVGHSFGGKVALEALRNREIGTLRHVVTIDSSPAAREPITGGDSALAILDIIKSLPDRFGSISSFVAALEGAGMSRDVAQWLAGSVRREGDHVQFSLDLAEIRALLLDYFKRDLWPVVENPPGATRVHLVIGDRSTSYSAADRDRALRIAASNQRVTVDVLATDHLVHVEDADGLVGILLRYIQ